LDRCQRFVSLAPGEDSSHYSQNLIASKRYFSGVALSEFSEVPLKQG
jgi:hypothetical protein